MSDEKRYGASPTGKFFLLTDEMIQLRNGLADGLGFTLREPCSLTTASGQGAHFRCWEKKALTYPYAGGMASPYHCVAETDLRQYPALKLDGVELSWPEDVVKAAWALDKGKAPKPEKADPPPPRAARGAK